MYNLNVNVNVNPPMAANLLSVAAEVTPRTPEIVNSLIAMTNPFDGYAASNNNSSGGCNNNSQNDCDRSRLRNYSTSSGEPSPPSIQHTCSQLIKEGLKLTLQTKRRANNVVDDAKKKTRKDDNSADDEDDDESSYTRLPNGKLTPEDEERRRRRRERNKIAATKCRLKKREKTVILVQESETLETQNHVLKSQIQELETQRRRLVDMLNLHGPTCIKHPAPGDAAYQQQYPEQQPLPNYQENFIAGGATTTHHQSANTIVPDYGPVKVENLDAVQATQDFFASQQDNVHYSTNNATTNAIVGSSDAAGCPV